MNFWAFERLSVYISMVQWGEYSWRPQVDRSVWSAGPSQRAVHQPHAGLHLRSWPTPHGPRCRWDMTPGPWHWYSTRQLLPGLIFMVTVSYAGTPAPSPGNIDWRRFFWAVRLSIQREHTWVGDTAHIMVLQTWKPATPGIWCPVEHLRAM